MKIARNFLLLLLALSLFWLLAGCQSDVSPQATTGEPAFELKVDILGRTLITSLDSEGRLVVSASLASPDGAVILSIDKGTRLLDKDGKPVSSIWMKTEPEPLIPPKDAHIIGAIYSLGPQDAVFDRPLKLTLNYEPKEIPEGVRADDVYIIPYDENTGWGSYSYKRVETDKHRVTTQIESFTRYAVLAPARPSSPQQTTKAKKAIVEVKAYQNLPSGCPAELLDSLKAMERRGEITLELIDFSTREGLARTQEDGLTCAGIVINGEMIFNLDGRLVSFSHPEGYSWTMEDLSEVVNRILNLPTSYKKQETVETPKVQNESGIVEITAYYDIGMQRLPRTIRTVRILQDVANKYKDRVAIHIVDIATEEGIKQWQTSGLIYSGLIINGKNSFVVEGKEVSFIFPVDYYWTEEDLIAVIESR